MKAVATGTSKAKPAKRKPSSSSAKAASVCVKGEQLTFAVFDFETTGLLLPSTVDVSKQPRAIELAVALVRGNAIIATHEWRFNPQQPLPAIITKITGLTDADLYDQPPFSQTLTEIVSVFKKAAVGIAHNAPFDVGILTHELTRAKCSTFPMPPRICCTVQEYFHQFGYRPKMTELYERILKRPLAQKHRALDDVRALVELLIHDNFFTRFEEAPCTST